MGILNAADREAVVVNWKSRVGGLFYSATALTPVRSVASRTFQLEDDATNSTTTNALIDFRDEGLRRR